MNSTTDSARSSGMANGFGKGTVNASSKADAFDEDLDFHLEFPSADFKKDFCTGENGEQIESLLDVGSNGKGKEPLVILFGWAGSQDKYLSKYSEIYRRRG